MNSEDIVRAGKRVYVLIYKITEDNCQSVKDYSNWSRRIGLYKASMITALRQVIIKDIMIIIKIIKYLQM